MSQHIGFAPFVSLSGGMLCAILGSCLLINPEAGIAAFMIIFPIWIISHCISRLSHINIIHKILGHEYYILTIIINIIGLILGIAMVVWPGLSIWTGSIMLGIILAIIGVDHMVYAFYDFRNK